VLRFGYPIAFLERQKVLEILLRSHSCHERVHLNSKVESVEATDDGVVVTTTDRARYHGHLVVGADGVHSCIRSEIWKAARDGEDPIVTENEKKGTSQNNFCSM
jgi:FAD dependent monooxygenase